MWVAFDPTDGTIKDLSRGELSSKPNRIVEAVPESLIDHICKLAELPRFYKDIRATYIDGKLSFIDLKDEQIDQHYNKLISMSHVRKDINPTSDLVFEITSKDFKPIMRVLFIGNSSLKTDVFRNKVLVHLTAKNNITEHYQSFSIDLSTIEDNQIEFDIDRCDHTKLFENNFSLYYRKKVNAVYKII